MNIIKNNFFDFFNIIDLNIIINKFILVKEIIKMSSLFECGICFKVYNHNDKKPIALPCGHSFCLECTKQMYKN